MLGDACTAGDHQAALVAHDVLERLVRLGVQAVIDTDWLHLVAA